MRQIAVTVATPENFKAFGALLSNENKQPDGGDENYHWWERLALLEGIETASINILEAQKREMRITKLEYHRNTPEVIVPLGGGAVILVVAPQGDLAEDRIEAFKIESGKGVILNPGVRHFIPYPLEENVNCLIIFKDATGSTDLIFDPLSEAYQIQA